MTMGKPLKGEALASAYAALKSIELRGHVWAVHTGRYIEIRGEELPMHPQHPHKRASGWSLLDRKTVAHCREYLANRGCIGQWHAYDPAHVN